MLIGLTGKAGAGKTEVCGMIRDIIGETSQVNFKDPLINEIIKNFPDLLDEILLDEGEAADNVNSLFRTKPPLMRALMQNYGTEVRRREDPDYWVNQWKKKVSYTKGSILIDDVRFINEAEAVKYFDGVIIRVTRDDIKSVDKHASELEMDKIIPDYTINGKAGDLDNLQEQVVNIIAEIK